MRTQWMVDADSSSNVERKERIFVTVSGDCVLLLRVSGTQREARADSALNTAPAA
jgi:hypothetical protein